MARGPGLEPGSAAPKAAVLPIGRPPNGVGLILAAASKSRHGILPAPFELKNSEVWDRGISSRWFRIGDEEGDEDVRPPG